MGGIELLKLQVEKRYRLIRCCSRRVGDAHLQLQDMGEEKMETAVVVTKVVVVVIMMVEWMCNRTPPVHELNVLAVQQEEEDHQVLVEHDPPSMLE